jgi:hypothetical protein
LAAGEAGAVGTIGLLDAAGVAERNKRVSEFFDIPIPPAASATLDQRRLRPSANALIECVTVSEKVSDWPVGIEVVADAAHPQKRTPCVGRGEEERPIHEVERGLVDAGAREADEVSQPTGEDANREVRPASFWEVCGRRLTRVVP